MIIIIIIIIIVIINQNNNSRDLFFSFIIRFYRVKENEIKKKKINEKKLISGREQDLYIGIQIKSLLLFICYFTFFFLLVFVLDGFIFFKF